MEKKNGNCNCGTDAHYVLSCSGACDVGHVSDLVARELGRKGVRKMNCLAVLAAGITQSIETFKNSNVLIIDGCPVDCGRKIAESAGLEGFSYLRVTDLGYEKGKTGVQAAVVQSVFDKACTMN